jgi:hypothetical protein
MLVSSLPRAIGAGVLSISELYNPILQSPASITIAVSDVVRLQLYEFVVRLFQTRTFGFHTQTRYHSVLLRHRRILLASALLTTGR